MPQILMPCGEKVSRIDTHIPRCRICLMWWSRRKKQ